jgi:hypothetical protein
MVPMPPAADVIATLDGLLRPLLGTLERIGWVQRHLFPPLTAQLAETLAPQGPAIRDALH